MKCLGPNPTLILDHATNLQWAVRLGALASTHPSVPDSSRPRLSHAEAIAAVVRCGCSTLYRLATKR